MGGVLRQALVACGCKAAACLSQRSASEPKLAQLSQSPSAKAEALRNPGNCASMAGRLLKNVQEGSPMQSLREPAHTKKFTLLFMPIFSEMSLQVGTEI